jgi:DNA (cytosine-5)-methyltransferase 1
MESKNKIKIKSNFESLYELVHICYEHVAPNDIDVHFHRIESLKQPEIILSSPSVLYQKKSGIKFADLFCGAGGLSLGFELEGAICKYALDNDSSALATFAINRPKNIEINHSDIRSVLDKNQKFPSVPLTIGGPPCQGFSLANQQPLKSDPRNKLYLDFLELAERFQSKVVLIENVTGILKYWDSIQDDLKIRGFVSRVFQLDAYDFGVPQKRLRAFIVAIKDIKKSNCESFLSQVATSIEIQKVKYTPTILEDAIYGLPLLEAKTISNSTHIENDQFGYSIGGMTKNSNKYLDRINEGFSNGFIFNHRTKYNNTRDINLFKSLKQGEDTTSEAFAKLNPYKNRDHIFKDKFFRLHANRPSKTITAHMYYDCHMYIHPTQHRGLTPREAARVQGFPDQYLFLGKPNEWYRQIGNSVSPLVGRVIARSVLNAINTQL